jgi:hypothetical protein
MFSTEYALGVRVAKHPLRHLYKPSFKSLIVFRLRNFRIYFLRTLEILLFGGEIQKAKSFYWNKEFPLVSQNVIATKVIVNAEIRNYPSYNLVNVDGSMRTVSDKVVINERHLFNLKDVVVHTRSGIIWNKQRWILEDSCPAGIDAETHTYWRRKAKIIFQVLIVFL